MKSKKCHRMTIEELTLLMEEAEDKLKINPLDPSANSDYNKFFNMIQERDRAQNYIPS